VAGVFSMASLAIDDVKHHSEEKGKKAARAINSLDALFEEAQKRRKLPLQNWWIRKS
jgi:predicted ribonuclease YlaK